MFWMKCVGLKPLRTVSLLQPGPRIVYFLVPVQIVIMMDALSDVDPFSYRLQCLPTRKAAFGPLRMLTKGTQTPATSIRLPLAHSPESEADGIPPRRGMVTPIWNRLFLSIYTDVYVIWYTVRQQTSSMRRVAPLNRGIGALHWLNSFAIKTGDVLYSSFPIFIPNLPWNLLELPWKLHIEIIGISI